MNMQAISIVIPAYNAARTLAETLDSVLAQEGVAPEIVLVDDGSTDGTLDIARRFEPSVRVMTGPNRGVSVARNRGIAETQASWIVFVDADDWLKPGTLATRLAAANETDADVVITDWRDVIDDGSGKLTEGDYRAIDWAAMVRDAEIATATHVWATTAAILYRRELVERIGGFRSDLPVIQDARFLFDAAYHGARFVHAPHVGARYRVLPGSLSRCDPTRFWLDVLINGEQVEALWRARGALSQDQLRGLASIYDHAARQLFAAGHTSFFTAIHNQRALGEPLSRYSCIAEPIARIFGIKAAASVIELARTAATPFWRIAAPLW